MKKQYKFYRVRTTRGGRRIFILARSYKDALRIKNRLGGKIV